MAARMDPAREEEILKAYDAWDPSKKALNVFLQEQGIARQTLYNILARAGVMPKAFRARRAPGLADDAIDLSGAAAQADLEALLRLLEYHLEDLVDIKVIEAEVRRIRARLDS